MIPFSLVWCGFAIFWTYSATRARGTPVFFDLWGLMFVCVGLYFVFGRFAEDIIRRRKTSYGMTGDRVLILSGVFSRELKSIQPRAVSEISLTMHSDGTGTIVFGTPLPGRAGAYRGWPGGRWTPPAFEFIDTPQDVHRLIVEMQKAR